jgi:hypothetical protein
MAIHRPGLAVTPEWIDLTRRAALASHRLVGWIYWDPTAIANYAALGVPNGLGYYIASRAASLAPAGDTAVTAAFGSIHPDFVALALQLCRTHTTFEDAAAARDAAVVAGLRAFTPQICDELATLAEPLWQAADQLPTGGRVLFGSLRDWPRSDDQLLSAWLAINCIREWRGDTHWALQIAEGLEGTESGILDGAWRNYDDDWLPRSRGADDEMLAAAMERLDQRGFVTDGRVNQAGIDYRQHLEDRLDAMCAPAWNLLGADRTRQFLDLVEPVGQVFVERIDATAGPNWMPAARDRVPRRAPDRLVT